MMGNGGGMMGSGEMMGPEDDMGYIGQGEGMGPDGPGGQGYGMGEGSMMGGYGMGQGSTMGGYGNMPGNAAAANAAPLTVDEAREAVEATLRAWGNPDLAFGEAMIFDNHAYVEIVERSTGIGALEVLVDPVTRVVRPEYGPNMMWNRKYSLMMMGGAPSVAPNASAAMPIGPEEARQRAQQYLDASGLGLEAGEVTPFYGYYTIHTERDGQIVGMLSVNGYTGEVFPHTWHGVFVSMGEAE